MAKRKLKNAKRQVNYALGTLGIILLALGAYALFMLFNQGVTDLLTLAGITNFYFQMIIIISVVLLGLFLSGFNFWRAFRKMAKSN